MGWKRICSPKDHGGLGVKDLSILMMLYWLSGGGIFSSQSLAFGVWRVEESCRGGGGWRVMESLRWRDLRKVYGGLSNVNCFESLIE